MCFGRLFLEDYLMIFSLFLLLGATIIGQLCVSYIYNMVAVGNGTAIPSLDFMSDTTTGLRSFAALMILNYVGIWLIKLNFLLFFRRLGNHVKTYRIMWWVAVGFNLAAGAIVIGTMDYKCLMPPAEEVFASCNNPQASMRSYTISKVSCSLDVVCDVMSKFVKTNPKCKQPLTRCPKSLPFLFVYSGAVKWTFERNSHSLVSLGSSLSLLPSRSFAAASSGASTSRFLKVK